MEKTKSYFFLRFVTAIADLATIYCITILLQYLIYKFTFIEFSNIFVSAFIMYYSSSYCLLKGKTPVKLFTGIKVVKKAEDKLPVRNIIVREIIWKGMIGIILPAFFMDDLFEKRSVLFAFLIFAVILILSAIFLFIFKRTWWEILSQTQSIKTEAYSRRTLKYSFISITILFVVSVLVITYPIAGNKEKIITAFLPSYPVDGETKLYAEFVKTKSEDPVEYIFDLFKKNDIVVISERLHPEYTQYELVFRIIKDPRFIDDVGNIFTECGSVSFQDTLNSYLHTNFESDDQLNRSTASLQRNSNGVWPLWDNTNLFDFLKRVNKLNTTLTDSEKINWYFTDLLLTGEG